MTFSPSWPLCHAHALASLHYLPARTRDTVWKQSPPLLPPCPTPFLSAPQSYHPKPRPQLLISPPISCSFSMPFLPAGLSSLGSSATRLYAQSVHHRGNSRGGQWEMLVRRCWGVGISSSSQERGLLISLTQHGKNLTDTGVHIARISSSHLPPAVTTVSLSVPLTTLPGPTSPYSVPQEQPHYSLGTGLACDNPEPKSQGVVR